MKGGSGVMSMNHAGMVRMIDPNFGKLLKYLIIEIIKDIFTFFKNKAKGFFKWLFQWGRKQ